MGMLTLTPPNKPTGRPGRTRLAPLRNGEHLSRAEFERRWEATPDLRHAELIEGIVFMTPPISASHSAAHERLHHWLGVYARHTPGVRALISPSLRLDLRNEFQPDSVLRLDHPSRGRSRVAADGLLEGAPELVVEIALSSADYDAHEKRDVYERQGVQEYLLWLVREARCLWWALQNGVYTPLPSRAKGVTRSQVFPGLWLDLRALVAGDERRVASVLTRGLNSAEHAAFVRQLART
jgi:Uma2 family endonuclease